MPFVPVRELSRPDLPVLLGLAAARQTATPTVIALHDRREVDRAPASGSGLEIFTRADPPAVRGAASFGDLGDPA